MLDATTVAATVAQVLPVVRQVRRDLHRRPELSGSEVETTDRIDDLLRQAGLNPRVRTPKTGLTVDVGSGRPAVAFRADLDALPITEPPGQPFASEVPGVMHACGHDAHAAIGVGLALCLARLEPPGRVRILFQPAEETFPGGAYELTREGALDGISAIFGFHVDPSLDTGKVGIRPGAVTASADRFYITLQGPGGHTARPHATVDLVHAAGLVVTQLPSLLDRRVDARSPLALVFGRIHGGSADNVIPTEVELSGTVRTADRDLWDEVPGLVEKAVADLVAPLGATALVHYQRGIPPVVNDESVVLRLGVAMQAELGPDSVVPTSLSMGAEDFARYLEQVPGALIRLGCRVPSVRCDLHSAGFVLDEGCLEVGVRAALAGVLELLVPGPAPA